MNSATFCSTVTSQSPKEEKMQPQENKENDPKHQQKIKRKQFLGKLAANDEDSIPDEANLKDPPQDDCNKNSNATNPTETITNINLKSNDGSSHSVMNVTVSLPSWADEVNEDKLLCFAYVAINYSLPIGGIGIYMHRTS
jgi:hypothetical protein